MTSNSTINLLKSKDYLSPSVYLWEEHLKKASLIGLTVVLLVGAIVGGIYLLLDVQVRNLESRKRQLITQINKQNIKEGLYLSLKSRVGIVEKAQSSQTSWAKTLDIIISIASPPLLTFISVDKEDNRTIYLK